MDHNVAIVNLHRRYEDLEKKVGDRDYDAKILSASLELSRAPGAGERDAGEHDAQRGRQRDSSELEESAQDCAVGTERIATAVEAEQQLSERPPASVDAKEGQDLTGSERPPPMCSVELHCRWHACSRRESAIPTRAPEEEERKPTDHTRTQRHPARCALGMTARAVCRVV